MLISKPTNRNQIALGVETKDAIHVHVFINAFSLRLFIYPLLIEISTAISLNKLGTICDLGV